MSRNLSSVSLNDLTQPVMNVAFCLDLHFDSGSAYIWTGLGTRSINSKNYTGVGNLLTISPVRETNELSAEGIEVTLNGLDSNYLGKALDEDYQGRSCKLFVAFLDGTVYNQVEIFSGFMNQMVINEGPETSTISLSVENRLVELERVRVRRFTSEDQKSRYPSDLGFDFIADLQDKEVLFGRAE